MSIFICMFDINIVTHYDRRKKDSDENIQLITRIKDCYAAKSDTILTLLRFSSS